MTNADRPGCPDCQLTSAGGDVLRREVDRLRRTRPHGTWRAQVCQLCERVTHVFDPEEGWSLGAPAEGPSSVLEPSPAPPSAVPDEVVPGVEEPEAGVADPALGDSWVFAAR
jgi:hypothetical protein